MKKSIIYVIMFLGVFLYADISSVIGEIKNINEYRPEFKKAEKYNVFSEVSFENSHAVSSYKDNQMKLNAVFQDKANINGKWVKEGDYLEGYRVIKIDINRVVLQKEGKIKILKSKSKVLKVVK